MIARGRLFTLVALACLAIFSACGGGGSGSGAVPSGANPGGNGQGAAPALTSQVTFSVNVPAPATASARRNPRDVYISSGAASVSVQLLAVNGVSLAKPPAPVVANLTPGCGCAITVGPVAAAVGTNTYAVSTFTASGGGGTIISNGLIAVSVPAGGATSSIGSTTSLTLGGYVASISLAVDAPFAIGRAGTARLIVTARDASGAIIIGNTQFLHPIVVTVSGSGLALSGPGLQLDGSIQLAQPEQVAGPITLSYSGSGTGGVVSAVSQDINNATIGPATLTISPGLPPPTTPPATPPPHIYLVNGYDNTVVELDPFTHVGTTTPVRLFGGSSAGCPPALLDTPLAVGVPGVVPPTGLAGLTFDVSGDAISAAGPSCQSVYQNLTFFSFTPAAVGTSPPTIISTPNLAYNSGNPGSLAQYENAGNVFGPGVYQYDNTVHTLDTLANSGNRNLNTVGPPFVVQFAISGANATDAAELTTGCVLTPAYGSVMPCDYTHALAQGPNFAINGTGTIVDNVLDFGGNTSFAPGSSATGTSALIPVPPQPGATTWTGAANWIEGPPASAVGIAADGLSLAPNSTGLPLTAVDDIAVDGNLVFVLNSALSAPAGDTTDFAPAALCIADPSVGYAPLSRDRCADASTGSVHEFLTIYNLAQLSGTGAQQVPPIAVIGGDRFPSAFLNAAQSSQFAGVYTGSADAGAVHRLAVAGGYVFILNPYGSCNAASTNPQGRACYQNIALNQIYPSNTPNLANLGEIVAYPETTTGIHVNDGVAENPAIVINNGNACAGVTNGCINLPIAIAVGPPGTPGGLASVKRMPQSHRRFPRSLRRLVHR